jgi:hypothetical protein
MLKGSRKGVAYPNYTPDSRPIMLCEGELDTLLARQELGDSGQAITFGGCQDRIPDEYIAAFADKVVMCTFDGDQAGDAGYERLRTILPKARRLRPPESQDLTDVHGAIGLKSWVDLTCEGWSHTSATSRA